jgi:F-type H+-transporting ATPase subunit gamma
VVKTMKALAAVSIRQYERAVEALEDYNRATLLALQVALQHRPDLAAPKPPPANRLGVVVFGSDQGMCGQVNEQVVRHAAESLAEIGVPHEACTVIVVGERAAARVEDEGLTIEETMPVPGTLKGITTSVQDLLRRIQAWDARRHIRRVQLYYSRQLTGATYEPASLRLLPVDAQWLAALEREPWPARSLPQFTMDWNRLFSSLISEYLFVSIYRAFAESLASENASRLASMQGAERNIAERLRALEDQFHQQRQSTITAELLDIVSGFEALQEK